MTAPRATHLSNLTARADILSGRLQRLYRKRLTLKRDLAFIESEIAAAQNLQRLLNREIDTERRKKVKA